MHPPLPSLQESDRETLKSAASKFSTWAGVGSLLGISLGVYMAYRLRAIRKQTFTAFRATEKPTHVKFANGREEAIPDISPLMKPSTLGDFATYMLFGAGGIFVGGELGMLGGAWSAQRTIGRDGAGKERIDMAFRRFRADVLRREADQLEAKGPVSRALGL